ncbi:hypothetical protein G8C92_05055 [Paenibacillus donghaensis]|uniref:hypothetical protein n=1 Tax=Paenibacillus donghaensis TaxID=414771 RepID=UPI001883A60E|nr:hypothetical protein [Paenibacillus donghaensis]MBE9913412.1 hypothetical protein [Paenibacillus donghaensis]
MSKGLSLWFSCSSIFMLGASAILISYNGWIALLLGILAICNIGWGFVIKAKKNRANES